MIGKEALRGGPGHEDGLRRALLRRIANRLAVARLYGTDPNPRHLAECCWVRYDRECPHSDGTSHVERWVYALCDEDCPHWHHQAEVWMA